MNGTKEKVILMTIKVRVPLYKQREFFQICLEIILSGRQEKGCLGYFLQRDLEVDDLFHLETEWRSRQDIETYVRSQNFSTLLGATKILGNDIDLRISELIPAGGMETIRKIRQMSS